MPPRDIIFRVRWNTFIITNTVRMHTGMDTAMVAVAPHRRRKRNTTIAARITPMMMFCTAAFTAMLM